MVAPSSGSNSLKEYLKRYQSNEDEDKKKKKKKKNKANAKPGMSGVILVDEEPVWQKPVQIEEEDASSQDEEKPQVDEDIEVKRMKRLEQIKARRPFGAISEDGSGWVSVSDNAKNLNSGDTSSPKHELDADMSPPRKRRARFDTPSPEPNGEDMSPPRRHHRKSSSPTRRPGDTDMSPPRKRTARFDTPSLEPNGVDMSPPRRRHHRRSSSPPRLSDDIDMSPPRKRRARFDRPSLEPNSDPDLSPPRRRGQHKSGPRESDLSPPRKRRDDRNQQSVSGSDLSPPRKPVKESDRPKTGLVSGKDIKEEINKSKKEDWLRKGRHEVQGTHGDLENTSGP